MGGIQHLGTWTKLETQSEDISALSPSGFDYLIKNQKVPQTHAGARVNGALCLFKLKKFTDICTYSDSQ